MLISFFRKLGQDVQTTVRITAFARMACATVNRVTMVPIVRKVNPSKHEDDGKSGIVNVT